MADSFVSRKDRIIASAIEIISDSGLSSLTTRNLAEKENMSEALLYKYFGGINEVLKEVVDYYTRFDDGIIKTISSKDGKSINKVMDYIETYATYYDSYYAISTIMLQYEELLHKIETRDKIAWCISERNKFLEKLFQEALDNKEIINVLTARELAKNTTGIIMASILDRRIVFNRRSYKHELMDNFKKWYNLLVIER